MNDPKEPKFESAMERLNEIVEQLEAGDLSLDESLKLYEEGVKMSQVCNRRLDQAQKKIEVLVKDAQGKPSAREADAESLKPRVKKAKK